MAVSLRVGYILAGVVLCLVSLALGDRNAKHAAGSSPFPSVMMNGAVARIVNSELNPPQHIDGLWDDDDKKSDDDDNDDDGGDDDDKTNDDDGGDDDDKKNDDDGGDDDDKKNDDDGGDDDGGGGDDDDTNIYCSGNPGTFPASMEQNVGKGHGFDSATMAESVYKVADVVGDYLRNLVNPNHDDENPLSQLYPLRVALYIDDNDIKSTCDGAQSGPFVTGAGSAACDLLQIQASMKALPDYLQAVLAVQSQDDWNNAAKHVPGLGSTASQQFLKTAGGGVYTPSNNAGVGSISSLSDLEKVKGFYGSSGGGGGGFGFEIMCVTDPGILFNDDLDDDDVQVETLVSGGGGGGGGFSSPYKGKPIRVGGGGGGGAQSEAAMAGAGAGNNGTVTTNSDADIGGFINGMSKIQDKMAKCVQQVGSRLEVRGGGGGGAGFEVYQAWNFTDPNAKPTEITPHALSFGYGFQFVLSTQFRPFGGTGIWDDDEKQDDDNKKDDDGGDDDKKDDDGGGGDDDDGMPKLDKLIAADTSSGPTFVICPPTNLPLGTNHTYASNQCPNCFEQPSAMPKAALQIHKAFGCAPRVAASICEHAVASNGEPYGKYDSFLTCNNVVQAGYLASQLPASQKLMWKSLTAYSDNVPGMPPKITDSLISANKNAWCKSPPTGCATYPACS